MLQRGFSLDAFKSTGLKNFNQTLALNPTNKEKNPGKKKKKQEGELTENRFFRGLYTAFKDMKWHL